MLTEMSRPWPWQAFGELLLKGFGVPVVASAVVWGAVIGGIRMLPNNFDTAFNVAIPLYLLAILVTIGGWLWAMFRLGRAVIRGTDQPGRFALVLAGVWVSIALSLPLMGSMFACVGLPFIVFAYGLGVWKGRRVQAKKMVG